MNDGKKTEAKSGQAWNYPTLIPLLCHYYPNRIGYEALHERLASLEYRLVRLEECLLLVAKALQASPSDIERLETSRRPIDAVVTLEEEVLAWPHARMMLYVEGISDIRSLMPMVKVDKSKLPKFVIPVWVESKESMIAYAKELGLPLPRKYL